MGGVTKKMAEWLAKQVEKRPPGISKARAQSEVLDEQTMARMSEKELLDIMDKGAEWAEKHGKTNTDKGRKGIGAYSRADSASEELSRRYKNRGKEKEDKRQVGEYAKGGAVKKALAKKPTAAKKPMAAKKPVAKKKK